MPRRRHVGIHRHDGRPIHDGVGGEPGDTEVMVTGRPSRVSRIAPPISVPAALAALPGSHGVRPSVAQAGHWPAARQERHDDPLPDRQIGAALTDLLDDAGGLVTEQHRHRPHPVAVDDRQIGMA